MVRTYPVASAHFDPARVAAWSAAIALHLLAFLLLLVPATYQAITALPRDDTTVRLIPRELPPPPAPPTPPQHVDVVPKQQTVPRETTLLPPPTATLEKAQGIVTPAAESADHCSAWVVCILLSCYRAALEHVVYTLRAMGSYGATGLYCVAVLCSVVYS